MMTSSDRLDVYREYYEEADVFLSTEGIFKLLAILGCIVSVVTGAVAAGAGDSGGCSAGARLAGAALLVAAVLALLLAAGAARLTLRAPLLCLYTDIIMSAVGGAVIFVIAVLNMALCEHTAILDYVIGPTGVATSCAVTASSAALFRAATRALDSTATATASPAPAPMPAHAPYPPQHLDV